MLLSWLAAGGLGALRLVARRTRLIAAIDHDLDLLKRRPPFYQSIGATPGPIGSFC